MNAYYQVPVDAEIEHALRQPKWNKRWKEGKIYVSQYKYGRITEVIKDFILESFRGITAATCGDYSPQGAAFPFFLPVSRPWASAAVYSLWWWSNRETTEAASRTRQAGEVGRGHGSGRQPRRGHAAAAAADPPRAPPLFPRGGPAAYRLREGGTELQRRLLRIPHQGAPHIVVFHQLDRDVFSSTLLFAREMPGLLCALLTRNHCRSSRRSSSHSNRSPKELAPAAHHLRGAGAVVDSYYASRGQQPPPSLLSLPLPSPPASRSCHQRRYPRLLRFASRPGLPLSPSSVSSSSSSPSSLSSYDTVFWVVWSCEVIENVIRRSLACVPRIRIFSLNVHNFCFAKITVGGRFGPQSCV